MTQTVQKRHRQASCGRLSDDSPSSLQGIGQCRKRDGLPQGSTHGIGIDCPVVFVARLRLRLLIVVISSSSSLSSLSPVALLSSARPFGVPTEWQTLLAVFTFSALYPAFHDTDHCTRKTRAPVIKVSLLLTSTPQLSENPYTRWQIANVKQHIRGG
ncbi:hypothetical protein F5Y07DRAFT_400568 [Xylaria sp. FL0933]|nr:hypothetical protein F5Y07DRAFT_400568 [Xylaria sp. FL0933]